MNYFGIGKSVIILAVFLFPCIYIAAQNKSEKGATKSQPLAEINRIWMEKLHGSGESGISDENRATAPSTDSGQSKTEESPNTTSDAKKKAGDRAGQDGDVRLLNPGKSEKEKRSAERRELIGNSPRAMFPEREDSSFVSIILRFTGFLALMLGAFYLLVRFLKSRSGHLIADNDLVRVLVSVPLLQGKFLQIVDLAGKLLVLGVSESGVTIVHTVEDSRTADRIRLWQSNQAASPVLPAGLLGRIAEALRGKNDFRFWKGAEDSVREKGRSDFRALLKQFGGDVADPRLQGEPTEGDPTDVDGEHQYLQNLLSAQKKRIARLKKG